MPTSAIPVYQKQSEKRGNNMQLILGSQSPRRKQLLEMMGLSFAVVTAEVDESLLPHEAPEHAVRRLCERKAAAVAAALRPAAEDRLILTADTIVVQDGRILGKPADEAEAARMLRALSGREHAVYTAFALHPVPGEGGQKAAACSELVRTRVRFRAVTDDEIAAYIATGEPMDKAGAYGIQGRGSLLVEAIDGDFYTVMGLPVCRLAQALKRYGIPVL